MVNTHFAPHPLNQKEPRFLLKRRREVIRPAAAGLPVLGLHAPSGAFFIFGRFAENPTIERKRTACTTSTL